MENPLSKEEIEQFVERGFVSLGVCFDTGPSSVAGRWIKDSWTRNGIDPDDVSTWPRDKIHMPTMERRLVSELAPRAWGAMAQLCGGAERVDGTMSFGDGFIANYGWGRDEPWLPPSPESPGWHKDGDFFKHFLDSPEQALLTVVYYTDVAHRGGGTFIAPDSVGVVARFLAEHPEGVYPGAEGEGTRFPKEPGERLVDRCEDFLEVTGQAGEVFLLHPYMLHASSRNHLWKARLMINPCLRFKEPMRFDRPDMAYSPVERATLRGLGVDRYAFRPAAPRDRLTPKRIERQRQLKAEQERRLAERAPNPAKAESGAD